MRAVQIKDDEQLRVRTEPARFSVVGTSTPFALCIDDRTIELTSREEAPVEEIARAIAKVPKQLRDLIARVVVSPTSNPGDASWSKAYGLPVRAAMGATGAGKITIFPHGIAELRSPDAGVFVRNLMHELGHVWSVQSWAADRSSLRAWLDAIARDRFAPSLYALWSFRKSRLPYEDAAEATALYFLVLGTPVFHAHRRNMPARFDLLRARFHGD